ncbi:hypothetical protein EGW08_010920 [Elysia chlorotica]|uniref:Uncharacterized protein n=1 Tax=Elysia chlorotica TaxID=188477 RepID=A0A433TIE0_ELYCH|nr:hypothetical protein EGW08_010920 [Elysia chlorotica]
MEEGGWEGKGHWRKEEWSGTGRGWDDRALVLTGYRWGETVLDQVLNRRVKTINFGHRDYTTGDRIMHLSEHVTCHLSSAEDRYGKEKGGTSCSIQSWVQGQNKKTINCFCQQLIETGAFKSVDHIFPQRGHTFLPSDRDFNSIELRKRKVMPLIPSEWIEVIKESRLCQTFIVKEIKQEDFKDFKKASDETIKAAWKSDTGHTVKYREVMWFSYG